MSLKNIFHKLAPVVCIIFLYLIFYLVGIGCPIYYLTGIPCAGCGMTRAYQCLMQGDFLQAFAYHPLFLLPPLFLLLYFLRRRISNRIYRGGIIIMIFLFLIVYLYRLIQLDPVIDIQIREGKIYQILKCLKMAE